MLENKVFMGKHYSRIIASWVNGGGYDKYGFGRYFEEWLKTLEFCSEPIRHVYDGEKWVIENEDELHIVKLSDENISEIVELATCGMCEFEGWTETWIKENQDRIQKEREERINKRKVRIIQLKKDSPIVKHFG